MGGLAATHIGRRESSDEGGNVVVLPTDTDTRFRLLYREVHDLLSHVKELRTLAEEIGFASRTMYVDDYACVFAGASVSDFHFSLDTKEGRKILLITGEITVMARFVAGYLIRRHERSAELATYL